MKGVILLSLVIPYYDVSCGQIMLAGSGSTNACFGSSIVLSLSVSSLLVGIAVMTIGVVKHSRSRQENSLHTR